MGDTLNRFIANITAGLISGAVGIMVSVSFAALIFSGDLSDYAAAGMGIALFSAVVLRVVFAVGSSFPGVIADTDALPSAILALSAASIQQQLTASATPAEIFLTIAVLIALTSLLTGIFLLILGVLKIGELVRFIPYPVIGGFMGGLVGCWLKGPFK